MHRKIKLVGSPKKSKKVGRKWMCLFLDRNPEIRCKKVQNLSVNRALYSNPAVFKKWFEQYQGELERLNISSPEQIWNCDETGCQDVPKE